jgi:hypothetical protein
MGERLLTAPSIRKGLAGEPGRVQRKTAIQNNNHYGFNRRCTPINADANSRDRNLELRCLRRDSLNHPALELSKGFMTKHQLGATCLLPLCCYRRESACIGG